MNRRHFFATTLGAAAATALPAAAPLVPPTLPSILPVFQSGAICLSDARTAYNFMGQIRSIHKNLLEILPPGKKYRCRWCRVPRYEENPLEDIGFFQVVVDPNGEERPALDEKGMIDHLKTLFGGA